MRADRALTLPLLSGTTDTNRVTYNEWQQKTVTHFHHLLSSQSVRFLLWLDLFLLLLQWSFCLLSTSVVLKTLRTEATADDEDQTLLVIWDVYPYEKNLPRYPSVCVVTYRSSHQRWHSCTLHSSDDGGDEDEDGPDGVMKELLKQQKRRRFNQRHWEEPRTPAGDKTPQHTSLHAGFTTHILGHFHCVYFTYNCRFNSSKMAKVQTTHWNISFNQS